MQCSDVSQNSEVFSDNLAHFLFNGTLRALPCKIRPNQPVTEMSHSGRICFRSQHGFSHVPKQTCLVPLTYHAIFAQEVHNWLLHSFFLENFRCSCPHWTITPALLIWYIRSLLRFRKNSHG